MRNGSRPDVEQALGAIHALDPLLRACTVVRAADARAEAQRAPEGPLHGWTVAVKDNMDVAGTARSDGLGPPHGAPAERDAAAVARLRAAGAVVVAKTNLEALSLGATTQNPFWGKCRNPWDVERLPGGSSGGSAVAVATGMAAVALGTDTGGSVRNPATLCGITGLRPSPGWIPADGVTPLSPDFDVVGPMARSADELGTMLAVLAGRRRPERLALESLRVGVAEPFFYDDLHPDVAGGCDALLSLLEEAGARLVRVRLPGAEHTPAALATLANGQAAELHGERLDDERVDPQVRDRLALGRDVTLRDREAAERFQERWRRATHEAFGVVDLLAVPASPEPAPLAGSGHLIEVSARINRTNSAWSLARLPALSLPCPGRELPVGAQLVGPPHADWRLLDAATAVQRRTDWHERRPQPAIPGVNPQ